MPSMKVSLPGLFANIKAQLPKKTRDYYGFSLDELQAHLEALAAGKHTVAEFAEHYCIEARTR